MTTETIEILQYAGIILVCKTVEMLLSSMKYMVMGRGHRGVAVTLALIEALVWAFVISGSINRLQGNILWSLSYCLAYAFGYALGMCIEGKMALGNVGICVIVERQYREVVEEWLADNNLGYFAYDGHGARGENTKFDIVAPRKQAKSVRKAIESLCGGKAFTTNTHVEYIRGGYTSPVVGGK